MQITFDPEISEWDNPAATRQLSLSISEANGGNWNILVPPGRENKWMIPPVVASERGRAQTVAVAMRRRGCRTVSLYLECEWNVNGNCGQSGWEPLTRSIPGHNGILSNAEHEKFCANLPGPSGKAKYSHETDSEPVPWGKGEKHLDERSETDPETMRLQAVGAAFGSDGVPFA